MCPLRPFSFLPPVELPKQASRKLPLLCSGDAKGGTVSMGGDGGENNVAGGTINPNGEDTIIADAIPPKDGAAAATATAAPVTDKQASVTGETTSSVSLTLAETVKVPYFGKSTAANGATSVGQSVDHTEAMDPQNNEDIVNAAEVEAKGQVDDEKEINGLGQGDGAYGNGEDDDDLSSSAEGENDSNGWADVEDGERTGYSGAEVEPFAVKEGVDGSCVMEVCGAERLEST